jgi:lipopolysaccharide export system protein LptC
MAHAGDGYSRMVAWMKILLPLLALAILSTLFLVSRTIDPTQSIPYADVDVEGLARDQRIGAPAYSGMTEDGAAIRIAAERARPEDGGKRMIAIAPSARIDLPGGRSITIAAAAGSIDQTSGIAALEGHAVIASSDGYRVETDSLTARLDRTGMDSGGPVTGTAPFGDLTAGKLVLVQSADGGYVLRFEGGVKLIYRPGT